MTNPAITEPERKRWMSLLAKASPLRLQMLLDGLGDHPDHSWLRVPETGGVMVQGRMGGTGAPFNLGEMTVTRCALRIDSGEVGHGYVQGRDRDHAGRAALVDALMQTPRADEIEVQILGPLASEATSRAQDRAAHAAATKVEFFTMARGED
ncbi:phosphonate C-P lyase system protein PhnG [Rhodobacteraceae bacterium M382]|nr:phosphonate C-P lyase system protein PhnG [Rhodobacteraceae bacterium M382]